VARLTLTGNVALITLEVVRYAEARAAVRAETRHH
jgi:hypothetical protein